MKRLLTLYLCLLLSICSFAIPSRRVPFTVAQGDGTELTLLLIGDESYHYLSTMDGIPVVENDGNYFYASVSGATLVASDILAHDKEQRTEREHSFIASVKDDVNDCVENSSRKRFIRRNEARARQAYKTSPQFGTRRSYTGKRRGLVILVNFPDLKMKDKNTKEQFYRAFNEKNYSDNGHNGSVHDYFYDQSYGMFDIDFDFFGPVTLQYSYSYYGKNNGNGDDKNISHFVEEACVLASKQGCDFSIYDWDGDNEADQVFIIYAGPGEHTGAGSNYIWPHEWSLTEIKDEIGEGDGPITIGNITIDKYATTCELANRANDTMAGIGTACHEFSHCLGLPDIYCTNPRETAFAMGFWDPLCKGVESGPNNNGERPCGFTAYERWMTGWLEPIELSQPCEVKGVPCIGDAPTAFIIYNDGNPNEYFLLENRQPSNRWFKYTSSYEDISGLLIYHVDYDEYMWNENMVNFDPLHLGMRIVPADNSHGRAGTYNSGFVNSRYEFAGDLFPGMQNVTGFTNTSHVKFGGELFNMNTDGSYNLNKPVTNIKEENGLISFTFMGGGKDLEFNSIISDTSSDEPAEYYSISGIRTSKSALSNKGLYIMRKNGVIKKYTK